MSTNAEKGDVVERQVIVPSRGTLAHLTVREPENARIIVDLGTMEQAERVEETIKTGYVEAIIGNLVNWIAVEEDLMDSYEEFAISSISPEEREAANQLHILSSSDADILRRKLEEFEGLESEYKKRIQLLRKLTRNDNLRH